MRCCVPGCKNDSRHISKSQGITFHVFPTEPSLRSAWLSVLGRETWQPKERSTVCSEHFLTTDLYETRTGLRKVRAGAVPHLSQDKTNCFDEIPTLNVCRICFATEGKMYDMKKYKLGQIFEDVTGVAFQEDDFKPQKLCIECGQRLLNCGKFKEKSLRANTILTELLNIHDNLTVQLITVIDRESNYLNSSLQTKIFNPDHYDVYIEHTDKLAEISLSDMEVKDEENNEIFLNEDDDFNNEDALKDENNQEIDQQLPVTQEDMQTDQDELIDEENQEFAGSDKEFSFSSDDSIPLVKTRTRKKLKQKKPKPAAKVGKRKVKTEIAEPKIDRRRKPFLNDDLNESLFTITDLTFEEQKAEILKRQDSANYKNAVFKCTECFKGFLDENAYHDHMSRHTKECGEYQCEICKTHFKHSHALRKHITAHHTQRFSCNQCPYVTTHRQTARLHERWHKGTKYQCPHCPEEFVKFTTYMGHIRIKHPSDFVCQLCGFSFVSEKGIELHKKLKHRLEAIEIPDDGPLCELCNVRFKSLEAHRQHLRVSARHNTSDNEERESNKRKSGRKSRDLKDIEKKREEREKEMDDKGRVYPSQIRKAEGPIPCEQCGLQLEDSRAYHSHFRRSHPDKNRTNYPSMKSPCMCELCGRMFQSYALLKDHRWTHTGERPFRCDACGKTFRMKQRLVSHRRVHAQVKRSYVCNLCGKQFSTHSNRQRHMFIHTGLKPFKCEMCGKSFKHASEKRAHITYVHLKKPWPKRSRGKRRSDSRQGPIPPQSTIPTGASEIDIVQPLWPACDPKLDHLNNIDINRIDDKAIYYNLKI